MARYKSDQDMYAADKAMKTKSLESAVNGTVRDSYTVATSKRNKGKGTYRYADNGVRDQYQGGDGDDY